MLEVTFLHRHVEVSNVLELASLLGYLNRKDKWWFLAPVCNAGIESLLKFLDAVKLAETMAARPMEDRVPIIIGGPAVGFVVAVPKDFICPESYVQAWNSLPGKDEDCKLTLEEITADETSSVMALTCAAHDNEARFLTEMLGHFSSFFSTVMAEEDEDERKEGTHAE